MSNHDYAELAASILKQKPAYHREPGLTRDRGIAIVAQAMRQTSRSRQRARVWLIGSAAAAAAAAAVVVLSAHLPKKPASSVIAGTTSACGNSQSVCGGASDLAPSVDVGHMNGHDILPGSIFQADSGKSARVHFDSGTHMSLDANTKVAYDEGASVHRFSMSRGAVHLQVAKLTKGQRFLLNTLDAEVEVRGTVFSVKVVEPSQGCGQRTQVSVEEGVVEVRTAMQLHTLHAGDRWPGSCVASQAKSDQRGLTPGVLRSGASVADLAKSETTAGPVGGSIPASSNKNELQVNTSSGIEDPLPKSALAQQNDIYARASTERRLGHTADAIALYQQLITRFPASALVESAFVQRLRLLREAHDPEAKAEARRYLELFSQGFARAEALAILDSP
jgi:ferric-dicitrate binding protein FerR (iron transport regulator)